MATNGEQNGTEWNTIAIDYTNNYIDGNATERSMSMNSTAMMCKKEKNFLKNYSSFSSSSSSSRAATWATHYMIASSKTRY